MLFLLKITRNIIPLLAVWLATGCAVVPGKLDNQGGSASAPFIRTVQLSNSEISTLERIQNLSNYELISDTMSQPLLSRGDKVKLKISSMNTYDGIYQINSLGQLELPFGSAINASKSTRRQVIEKVQTELYTQGWFQSKNTPIDISLVQAASIEVSVFGAVFSQGRVTINSTPAMKPEDVIQQIAGDYAANRDLIAALSAAGGVRPDANLNEVVLKRANKYYLINLNQLITGAGFGTTPTMAHGDEVYVSSNGVEDIKLIRPSQITPPGMRVLMSNLTAPALNNAQSAVGSDSTRLPYGSSLLDAALSANCVGGTQSANASRSVILITRNYGSKHQVVIRRSINQLLATSSDYSNNPYLMPNDGVACYDSRFTNIRDVARGIGEVFGPILLGGLL